MAEADFTSTSSDVTKNPHFRNVERAPYELGNLLRQVPENFASLAPTSRETLLIAGAAAIHADNAHDSLMSGLESLGAVMSIAGANGNVGIGGHHLMNLGALIQHIAVEAQFLQETESDLRYIIEQHESRSSTKK